MGDHHTPNLEFDEAVFRREIKHPVIVDDRQTGNSYGFYMLNRQFEGEQPLVIYTGLGSSPNTIAGQLHLKPHVRTIKRPIIAPMSTHSTGAARYQEFANGHVRALDQITDQPVEIAGMSWGGVLAYLVAESIGERANHLVTASSVGTMRGLGRYALASARFLASESRQLKGTILDTMHDIDLQDIRDTPPSLHQNEKLRLTRLLGKQTFQRIPARLHPQTTWHDIVGQSDIFTSVDDHVDTVARRNQLYPKSSRISIVTNHGHLWSHMRQPLARLVSGSLANQSMEPAIEYLRSRDDFSGVDKLPPTVT